VNGGETSQSMLGTDGHDGRLKPAERELLDAIANGELDHHLVAIADAVQARRELLHANIRPRYLRRQSAVIAALDDHWVTGRPLRRR
jgi:hypothetical protein